VGPGAPQLTHASATAAKPSQLIEQAAASSSVDRRISGKAGGGASGVGDRLVSGSQWGEAGRGEGLSGCLESYYVQQKY
jgi:hypothetical protein